MVRDVVECRRKGITVALYLLRHCEPALLLRHWSKYAEIMPNQQSAYDRSPLESTHGSMSRPACQRVSKSISQYISLSTRSSSYLNHARTVVAAYRKTISLREHSCISNCRHLSRTLSSLLIQILEVHLMQVHHLRPSSKQVQTCRSSTTSATPPPCRDHNQHTAELLPCSPIEPFPSTHPEEGARDILGRKQGPSAGSIR